MRMDLRLVGNAGRAKVEAFHRPVEIGFPVRPAQRQAFAQGRLVDLDHRRPRLGKVMDLVANGQRNLLADGCCAEDRRGRTTS